MPDVVTIITVLPTATATANERKILFSFFLLLAFLISFSESLTLNMGKFVL